MYICLRKSSQLAKLLHALRNTTSHTIGHELYEILLLVTSLLISQAANKDSKPIKIYVKSKVQAAEWVDKLTD